MAISNLQPGGSSGKPWNRSRRARLDHDRTGLHVRRRRPGDRQLGRQRLSHLDRRRCCADCRAALLRRHGAPDLRRSYIGTDGLPLLQHLAGPSGSAFFMNAGDPDNSPGALCARHQPQVDRRSPNRPANSWLASALQPSVASGWPTLPSRPSAYSASPFPTPFALLFRAATPGLFMPGAFHTAFHGTRGSRRKPKKSAVPSGKQDGTRRGQCGS